MQAIDNDSDEEVFTAQQQKALCVGKRKAASAASDVAEEEIIDVADWHAADPPLLERRLQKYKQPNYNI